MNASALDRLLGQPVNLLERRDAGGLEHGRGDVDDNEASYATLFLGIEARSVL